MINIGTFKKTDTGFTGTIRTLTVNVKATLVPNEKRSENAPDYRLLSNSVVEIGAVWQKIAKESERPYLSITFDDPSFSGPPPLFAATGLTSRRDETFCARLLRLLNSVFPLLHIYASLRGARNFY